MATFYKALTKSQLAAFAGVCPNTLASWIRSIEDKLIPWGYRRNQKYLLPRHVRIIVEHFCIDVPDSVRRTI